MKVEGDVWVQWQQLVAEVDNDEGAGCGGRVRQQMLWILTLTCLQFTGDYWIRHVHPDIQ